MAQQLKTITCPRCGSAGKTEIKPGFFRCNSCGTEYYLEDNDVNVNVNVRHSYDNEYGSSPVNKNVKKSLAGLVIGVCLLIVLMLFTPLLFRSFTHRSFNHEAWKSYELGFPVASQGKVLLFAFYSQNIPNDESGKQACYGGFIDPETKEVVKEIALPEIAAFDYMDGASPPRRFSDGLHYLTVNNKAIYAVNPSKLTVENLTERLFRSDPVLSAGVAMIEPGYSDDGEKFVITTNTGESIIYYPLTGQKFRETSLGKHYRGQLPVSADSTVYEFRNLEQFSRGRDKCALLARKARYEPGGAGYVEQVTFEPSKATGTAAFFEERIEILPELTPGRIFFDPRVLCGTSEDLLIIYYPTPAEPSDPVLQRLDPKTGKIIWTTPIVSNTAEGRSARWIFDQSESTVASAGGRYLIRTDVNSFALVDSGTGTILREFVI